MSASIGKLRPASRVRARLAGRRPHCSWGTPSTSPRLFSRPPSA